MAPLLAQRQPTARPTAGGVRCIELTHQSNGNHRDGLADAALAVPFCTFVGVEYRCADRPPADRINADEFNIGRGDSA